MNTMQNLLIASILTVPVVMVEMSLSPAQAAALSGDEIKAALKGNTYKYNCKTSGTQKWTAKRTTYNDSKWGKGKGKWWVDGNKYCSSYDGGDAKCHSVKSLGNGVLSMTAGCKMTPF